MAQLTDEQIDDLQEILDANFISKEHLDLLKQILDALTKELASESGDHPRPHGK